MTRASIVIALLVTLAGACVAPSPGITPRVCGSPCNSSDECRNTAGACRICFHTVCTDTLPAQPISDAGVDAPSADTHSENGASNMDTTTSDINQQLHHDDGRGNPATDERATSGELTTTSESGDRTDGVYDDPRSAYDASVYGADVVGDGTLRCDVSTVGPDGYSTDRFAR